MGGLGRIVDARNSSGGKFVAVMLAVLLSMQMFNTTALVYAVEEGGDSAAPKLDATSGQLDPTSVEVEPTNTVPIEGDVWFAFSEGSYAEIVSKDESPNQELRPDINLGNKAKLTTTLSEGFSFIAKVDTGYELTEIKAKRTIEGIENEVEVTTDINGISSINSSDVDATLVVEITAAVIPAIDPEPATAPENAPVENSEESIMSAFGMMSPFAVGDLANFNTYISEFGNEATMLTGETRTVVEPKLSATTHTLEFRVAEDSTPSDQTDNIIKKVSFEIAAGASSITFEQQPLLPSRYLPADYDTKPFVNALNNRYADDEDYQIIGWTNPNQNPTPNLAAGEDYIIYTNDKSLYENEPGFADIKKLELKGDTTLEARFAPLSWQPSYLGADTRGATTRDNPAVEGEDDAEGDEKDDPNSTEDAGKITDIEPNPHFAGMALFGFGDGDFVTLAGDDEYWDLYPDYLKIATLTLPGDPEDVVNDLLSSDLKIEATGIETFVIDLALEILKAGDGSTNHLYYELEIGGITPLEPQNGTLGNGDTTIGSYTIRANEENTATIITIDFESKPEVTDALRIAGEISFEAKWTGATTITIGGEGSGNEITVEFPEDDDRASASKTELPSTARGQYTYRIDVYANGDESIKIEKIEDALDFNTKANSLASYLDKYNIAKGTNYSLVNLITISETARYEHYESATDENPVTGDLTLSSVDNSTGSFTHTFPEGGYVLTEGERFSLYVTLTFSEIIDSILSLNTSSLRQLK